MTSTVLINGDIATMESNGHPYGLITNGAVVIKGTKIAWVGKRNEIPESLAPFREINLEGAVVSPGLIDCHTHIVHGGDRALEFEMRLSGHDYQSIARAGGGIISTVKATRDSSQEELVTSALPRLNSLLADGVTTIEIKSGYGLSIKDEIKMLLAARKLAELRVVNVQTSWLAAHAIPFEFQSRADAYIDEVAINGLRIAQQAGLVDAVDGFCEGIAFTVVQLDRLYSAASQMEIPIKIHAEQLSNTGGAKLAARYHALSADHLEYLDPISARAMCDAGTVAVLLPGACYTLCQDQKPPTELLRNLGVSMAVATDCNPGSSPLSSLLVAMNMACTLFGLTAEEALSGTTRNAAAALGLKNKGSIAIGKDADLAIWNIGHPRELAYRIGFRPLRQRIVAGQIC